MTAQTGILGGQQSRWTPLRIVLGPGGLAVVVCATAYLSLMLIRLCAQISTVWLANAIVLAVLIRRSPRDWPTWLLGAFVDNLASNLLVGDRVRPAIGLSLCNSAESGVAGALLGRFRPRGGFDLRHRESIEGEWIWKWLESQGFTPHVRGRGEEWIDIRKKGFKPRRWVVEQTFGCINRDRSILIRWSKEPENDEALLHIAAGILSFHRAKGK